MGANWPRSVSLESGPRTSVRPVAGKSFKDCEAESTCLSFLAIWSFACPDFDPTKRATKSMSYSIDELFNRLSSVLGGCGAQKSRKNLPNRSLPDRQANSRFSMRRCLSAFGFRAVSPLRKLPEAASGAVVGWFALRGHAPTSLGWPLRSNRSGRLCYCSPLALCSISGQHQISGRCCPVLSRLSSYVCAAF